MVGTPYFLLLLKSITISAKLVFIILIQFCLLMLFSFAFDAIKNDDLKSFVFPLEFFYKAIFINIAITLILLVIKQLTNYKRS